MGYQDSLKVFWITPPRTASRSCNPFLEYFDFTMTGHQLDIPENKLHYHHICNVRHPYSRLFSLYKVFYYRKNPHKTFETWLNDVFDRKIQDYDEGIFFHKFLSKTIDDLVRVEFLEEDLKKIFFIKENLKSVTHIFETHIKKNNYTDVNRSIQSNLNPWNFYYNQKIADLVYKNLEKQFELFNYNKDYWKDGTP